MSQLSFRNGSIGWQMSKSVKDTCTFYIYLIISEIFTMEMCLPLYYFLSYCGHNEDAYILLGLSILNISLSSLKNAQPIGRLLINNFDSKVMSNYKRWPFGFFCSGSSIVIFRRNATRGIFAYCYRRSVRAHECVVCVVCMVRW